jgi:hypothetical protein
VVTRLLAELGFEPLAAGPLTQARYLEPLAMLWISMAYRLGGAEFRVPRRAPVALNTRGRAIERSETSAARAAGLP